jgi:hypothetical protein
MSLIKISKGGLIHAVNLVYNYELKKEAHDSYLINDDEQILLYLSSHVELDNGFSLRDYFKLLENYHFLQMLDDDIQDFLDEYKELPKIGCLGATIVNLNLSTVFSIDDKAEGNICYGFDFYCWDGKDKQGIDLLPLSQILDAPLIIDNGEIEHYDSSDDVESNSNDNYNSESIKCRYINLFSFLKGIMEELAFYGSPKEKEDIFNTLK